MSIKYQLQVPRTPHFSYVQPYYLLQQYIFDATLITSQVTSSVLPTYLFPQNIIIWWCHCGPVAVAPQGIHWSLLKYFFYFWDTWHTIILDKDTRWQACPVTGGDSCDYEDFRRVRIWILWVNNAPFVITAGGKVWFLDPVNRDFRLRDCVEFHTKGSHKAALGP